MPTLTTRALRLHPDRLLPTAPEVRSIARRLYDEVRDLPILSPHGHVEAQLLLDDQPFPDPTTLLITPDHYVTRLLHASGVSLDRLGVGQGPLSADAARAAWRLLCEHWDVYRGTPVKYWLESALVDVFDLDLRPGPDTADELYDGIADQLAQPTFRPRALFDRFRIEVLATTDDPADDLAAHAALRADPTFSGRVVPTFRPDRYLEVGRPDWARDALHLGAVAGVDTGCYAGWVVAMEDRRTHFRRHGGVSTDHSHEDVGTEPLDAAHAERIYHQALAGTVGPDEATALRRHMLLEMARMATEDGLTMTLHPGVRRGHHRPTAARFGPDTGHDLPLPGAFTDALRPLLDRYGTHPNLTLVLFTLDESVLSRELAPLAGFYPSVYVGAPWWFLDAPDAIRRWRSAVSETAGLSRTSGFIDDTRAICSIPARHDMARRLDAGYLAGLVADHRLEEDEAAEAVVDLVRGRPTQVFGL
ncbi:glucuronate isomerase [Cellulomonas sp. Leaf334]|uniref:glucuronate isomerase n=1 Tax=Cellulomonas sp. Leaf334 TaxID=1736339 RepID=UPI0006F7762A|nr:glucuronate isomerase [Cellulomonas sp. Leaf334]KQR16260.1 glucuronate isomerase [Cellulomonas sp. Leaf334]